VAAGRVEQALTRFTEARSLSSYNQSIANECDLWIGDCNYRLGKYAAATKAFNQYLKSSSASGDNRSLAYYDLGYSLFAEKQYPDSRTAFERAVKSPGNLSNTLIADAYNRIGDCYYYATDFSHAATNYEKAYELNPDAGDYAMFQKAMMSGLKRDYTGKLNQIDNMMTSYPTSGLIPQAMLEKAESYVALNRYDDAIATYQSLVKRYPTTSQGRNGYLQLAITQIGQGKKSSAINSYKAVISNYPTSEEARVAADDLKRLLADEGRLSEYSTFIASVPDAPKFEVSELDELTFQAAEKAYLADNTSVARLKDYITQYPRGSYEPQALNYLAEAAVNAGNETEALKYASTLIERYPDSELAEDALAIKGNIELNQGEGEKALATFHQLEKRASASRNIHAARLGIMRVARDLGKHDEVITTADALLASSAIPASEKSEITYSRAYALAQTGKSAEALKVYEQLAKNTNDLYGAKAAYNIARYYYDNAQYKKAQTAVEKLIDSNTPHSYWLARGYILLSDICRKQGNTFEANEYLKSLKENYPGTESDIFLMIDQRLK
jgi:TolA-binding protein